MRSHANNANDRKDTQLIKRLLALIINQLENLDNLGGQHASLSLL